MKLVYSGQAIGLLPMQNGAIFAAKQKSLEHKIVISYMLYPFDSLKASPSTKSVYLLAKFGNRFREIEQQLNGYISCSAVALPGGKQLIVYPSGAAGLFDREGRAERGFTMQHEGNGPTGLCFHKGSVWAAYPEAGAIISYDPERFRQTMRLGGRLARRPPLRLQRGQRPHFLRGYRKIRYHRLRLVRRARAQISHGGRPRDRAARFGRVPSLKFICSRGLPLEKPGKIC